MGNEAAYYHQLIELVDAMHKSVSYWVLAKYKNNAPAMAQDATPATVMRGVMGKLSRRWIREFDDLSTKMATTFADRSAKDMDSVMRAELKKVGFAVEFTQTPAMRDALSATIGENIGLIKSIPSKYLSDVEGDVMRSVTAGRDLKTLSDDLAKRYDLTRNRAAFIARDQNNKATAVMAKARRLSLGIKQAKWVHSGGGVHPRKSHVAASGKLYDVEKGCLIDGEYIMPGELPNCRCQSKAVIPGFED